MLGALLATTYILYLFRSADQSTLEWMYIAIAAATDFSLSSRLNLTLYVAVSRLLSISNLSQMLRPSDYEFLSLFPVISGVFSGYYLK